MGRRVDESFDILTSNLIWLRKCHCLSKKKMAKILGIGVRTLCELESGKVPPRLSIEFLFVIHNEFGVMPGQLIGERLEK